MTTPNVHENCLVNISDVGVELGDKQILHGVSLTVELGRIITLIGPNGAGKTTLVRAILGLIEPDSGSVWVRPGITIGYMPQRLNIEPSLPMSVNRFLRLTGVKEVESIDAVLEDLKIEHLRDHPLQSISGGEMQRVLLARALLRHPQLLILDEPAQGVDVKGQSELYQLIDNICRARQCGILMISHDLHLVMATTDEVVCLNHHVCCHGKPEQVSNDPAFLSLFGKQEVESFAVYTHHHNHSHDIHGNVVSENDDRG